MHIWREREKVDSKRGPSILGHYTKIKDLERFAVQIVKKSIRDKVRTNQPRVPKASESSPCMIVVLICRLLVCPVFLRLIERGVGRNKDVFHLKLHN